MTTHQFTEPYRPREWEPTNALERQVARARKEMGEKRWAELLKEWDEGE